MHTVTRPLSSPSASHGVSVPVRTVGRMTRHTGQKPIEDPTGDLRADFLARLEHGLNPVVGLAGEYGRMKSFDDLFRGCTCRREMVDVTTVYDRGPVMVPGRLIWDPGCYLHGLGTA